MTAELNHPADAPALFWFRQDLRLADNPGLTAAVESGRPLACVFVLDDTASDDWALGGAARWWLHHSLSALSETISRRGGALTLRRGRPEDVIPNLAADIGAAEVHWNRCYEPAAIARDTAIKTALKAAAVHVQSHNGALLFEPWRITNGSGDPYRVFTPFWRACLQAGLPDHAIAAPDSLPAAASPSDTLDDWGLLPTRPDWAGGLRDTWTIGEAAAQTRLDDFLRARLAGYSTQRDIPGASSTSRLSPHLRWGEISARQIAVAARTHALDHGHTKDMDKFLSELGWREFSYSLLYHNPTLPEANLQTKFDAFPWRDDPVQLKAWQTGQTGYPIVDAGMRELYATGWMHNRVRMIVGSFLVKHLMLHWRHGEDWFWDTLVDADLANNAASWQWIAGSGADAAPYFRVFNPTSQAERFDPNGAYVRRWCPEIAQLPNGLLHQPWKASPVELSAAGVCLGDTYPAPIIDHAAGRQRALDAFESLKTLA